MKGIKLFLLAFVFPISLMAQVNDPYSGMLDEVYTKDKDTQFRKPVKYANLRSADVMWARRIWREIDVKQKFNQVFYFPLEPTQGRDNFFNILKKAIQEGSITAYDPGLQDSDMFDVPMTLEQVEEKWSTTEQKPILDEDDEPTGEYEEIFVEKDASDIIKYRIKEDVFFDKQRGVLEYRILGIAPIMKKDLGGKMVDDLLFWVYFPHARNVLASAEVYNLYNNSKRLTYDDIFFKRMFASTVIKEDNVYDRKIEDYKAGIDALLEAEEIKEKIFLFEHDVWSY